MRGGKREEGLKCLRVGSSEKLLSGCLLLSGEVHVDLKGR